MDRESILMEQMQAQRQMLEDALKELKEQNRQLKGALNQVKKRNQELTEIAYQTSHDLRGPASTLQGLANLMADENDPEIIQSFIKEVPELLAKIDIFSRSISDFTRIVNQPVDFQEIKWEDIFSKITAEEAIREKASLNLNAPQKFNSDPSRIETILDHLVKNAIQFNIRSDELTIDINIMVTDNFAELEVVDNGIGIEESEMEKIFNMFYRGSQFYSGSGVGLYLVKTLVEELNGDISLATSRKSSGACFSIRLPQLDAPVALPTFNF